MVDRKISPNTSDQRDPSDQEDDIADSIASLSKKFKNLKEKNEDLEKELNRALRENEKLKEEL